MAKKILLIFVVLILIIIGGVFGFIQQNNRPVSSDQTDKIFTVKSGEGIKSIAQKLESNGLIKNKYVFLYYTYSLSLSKKIQAGNFKLSPNLTTKEIAVKLTQSGVTDYWLKILEGLRVEELTDIFPKDSTISNTEFIKMAKNNEGYIFPDSYLIPQYFTLDQILSTIQANFNKQFTQAKSGRTVDISDSDAVILASLIEREGRLLKSKQMISGIIFNRLKEGMPLQIDATVQYARDSQNKSVSKYWQPVTSEQIKQTNSSFNTYQNPGLPPRPICNPGYNSLYAAFHPIESDYLYYITGDDGVMYYAKTLSEHNSNIANHLK
jgi:UPF0755 protein